MFELRETGALKVGFSSLECFSRSVSSGKIRVNGHTSGSDSTITYLESSASSTLPKSISVA